MLHTRPNKNQSPVTEWHAAVYRSNAQHWLRTIHPTMLPLLLNAHRLIIIITYAVIFSYVNSASVPYTCQTETFPVVLPLCLSYCIVVIVYCHCVLKCQFLVTFTFAICYRPSVCLQRSLAQLSPLKPSAMFLRHSAPWPSADIHWKLYGDRPRRTPAVGGLNARGAAKHSDFWHLGGYISQTVQDK